MNLQKELKFMHEQKVKVKNKKGLMFELLNAAQLLLINYATAKTKKYKFFYNKVYFMTKNFILKE